jgi:hypothetical protein
MGTVRSERVGFPDFGDEQAAAELRQFMDGRGVVSRREH